MAQEQVLKALHQMMQKIEGVNKEKRQQLNYEIVSYDHLLDVIRDQALEHGLNLIPSKCTHVNAMPYEVQRAKGPVHLNCDSFVFDFRLYHTSGEFLDVSVPSVGIDEADKGPGKAMTYAAKSAWLQVLMLKRGKDYEVDERPSEEMARPVQQQQPPAKPQPAQNGRHDDGADNPDHWPEKWRFYRASVLNDWKNETDLNDLPDIDWKAMVERLRSDLVRLNCPQHMAKRIISDGCRQLLSSAMKTKHELALMKSIVADFGTLEQFTSPDTVAKIKAHLERKKTEATV